MSRQVSIRDALYNEIMDHKPKDQSFSDFFNGLLKNHSDANIPEINNNFDKLNMILHHKMRSESKIIFNMRLVYVKIYKESVLLTPMQVETVEQVIFELLKEIQTMCNQTEMAIKDDIKQISDKTFPPASPIPPNLTYLE